jgi:4'-phosphopantetheinyl transferase
MAVVTFLWSPGPAAPRVSPNEVHVWAARLDRSAAEREKLARLLSPDEQERASRYVAPTIRSQFIVARGLLRAILAPYLAVAPEDLRFGQSDRTKPGLLYPDASLCFNVSHSGSVGLFAVSMSREIGVDVEQSRGCPTHLELAQRFFAPAEAAALTALPAEQTEEVFFRVWTRKEAFLKLTGLGLSGGLESFEVSVRPEEPARLIAIGGQPGPAARYALETLEPAEGYVGAVAVEGPEYQLRLFSWMG